MYSLVSIPATSEKNTNTIIEIATPNVFVKSLVRDYRAYCQKIFYALPK